MSFSLFDADDDWQEGLRARLYPRLHGPLDRLGARLGVPLYAVGTFRGEHPVGYLEEDEEVIETELVALGARRNPVACYKSLPDGRTSEGSWCFTHRDLPEYVERGMQLHLTLFTSERGPGREIYAHYEDDWRVSPLKHLRAANYNPGLGRIRARELLDRESHLVLRH